VYRWRMLVASAVVFGGIALLNAVGSASSGQNMDLTASRGSTGHETYSFAITGSPAKSLYPGVTRRIDLRFANPYLTPIRVIAVNGKLISTSKRGCVPGSGNLEVRSYRGRLPITVYPRSRTSAGYIELHMPNSVANACQGASFTIRFTGEATKAAR
jgi:hypothetical protein